VVTVIEEVVAPLLHNNEPEKSEAVNTEFSQLLTTETVGDAGICFGAATALAAILVQLFIVCVTVYAPAVDTVMEDEAEPLLHNNDPVKSEAVNMELSQLLTTSTVGAAGTCFGAATPLPAVLVQPLTVWVIVYAPAVDTVMDEDVSPVLHNKAPVKPAAVNTELPQLLATDTTGAFGVVPGVAVPLPALLVQPFAD
jgi:hypothetical protein